MSKKNDSKKSAKKPAPDPKAKAKPLAKPAPKPLAKAAPAKGKPAVPVKATKATKAATAPSAKGKGSKAVPVVPAKNVKVSAAAPAKGSKSAKASKLDHAVQKGLLNKHRVVHQQGDALVVVPRPKLQFFTINDLKAYLDKRNKSKSKLNVWVPDEERKAREKAAAAARSQGSRANSIATASISDLLGGSNPFRKGEGFVDEAKQVPEKFRRYYRLLVDMRDALHKGLAFHSEEALKKSGKDNAGDLSGYSQHLADSGTDTADRDFALSLISNEQEALKEIADAIERMKKGSYGTCEITTKPIPAARLIAVPFTRYSLEGQKELERNRRAHRRRGGNPLGEIGDEVGFGTGGGGGEDEPSDS
jgi:RNA polymerase-binding transcription factor DksA